MKTKLIIAALLIAATSFGQSKPAFLDAKEVDSTKQRLLTLSNAIAGIPELTQGKAAQLQQILQQLYNTIARKEEKSEEKKPAEKPKQ